MSFVLPWPGWRPPAPRAYVSVEKAPPCARPDRSLREPRPARRRPRGRARRTSRPSNRTRLVLLVAYAIAVAKTRERPVQNVRGLARRARGRDKNKRCDFDAGEGTQREGGSTYMRVILIFASGSFHRGRDRARVCARLITPTIHDYSRDLGAPLFPSFGIHGCLVRELGHSCC